MQASYSRLGFLNAFRALRADEGLLRLWKGSHVMALGCIPSHASYFLTYEKLKLVFGFDNQEFDYRSTLCIGALTTFVHDFFITPSDGK